MTAIGSIYGVGMAGTGVGFLVGQGIVIDPLTGIGVVAVMGGAVALMFRLLISSKDQMIAAKQEAHELALKQLADEKKEEESRKKSYQEIATEAIKSALETANFYRSQKGEPPVIPLAPVISESHSPSTPAQREAALIATMRAAVAKIKVEMGQEPRIEPPAASGDESPPIVDAAASLESALGLTPSAAKGIVAEASKSLHEAVEEIPQKTAAIVVEKLEDGGR